MCSNGFTAVQNSDRALIKNIQKNVVDGGYNGINWAQSMQDEFNIEIEITKRTDIANGVVSKIRWISERSFAWLDKCRRLAKNYEGTSRSVKSMIVLCFIRLLCRRLTGECTLKWIKKSELEI